jgi:cytochrome oxidase Cu insertion factor (SCO1/SenC/PrrC family)
MSMNPKSSNFFLTAIAGALLITLLASAQPVRAFQKRGARVRPRVSAVVYACPMDPEVTSRRPGKCPKCGMALRRREPVAAAPEKVASSSEVKSQTPEGNNAERDMQRPSIPDVTVYDQNSRQLNFYTDLVKGKTVIINFIFTTCTTICPPLTATFRRVQQELGERSGRDVQLISVSVDPTVDVPERLKEFAGNFKVGPGWSFVTGDRQEINRLLKSLGAYTADKNDHTPMILVGNDPAGFWTRAYGLSSASILIKLVNEASAKKPDAPVAVNGN